MDIIRMAYHKRDYLYSKNNTKTTTILIKNQGPLEFSADLDPISMSKDYISSEYIDTMCDIFYEMVDLSESQGLPLLQLCRFPNFLDFIQNKKNLTKT